MNPRSVLMACLRGYKRFVSPMLPPACRFEPTCSEYALEAVELHGAWRGSRLAFMRLLRCHPFSRGGFDPVPVPDQKPDDGNQAERSRLQAEWVSIPESQAD